MNEKPKPAKTISSAGISDDRRALLVNWTCWNCDRLHKKQDMLFRVRVTTCEKCNSENVVDTNRLPV